MAIGAGRITHIITGTRLICVMLLISVAALFVAASTGHGQAAGSENPGAPRYDAAGRLTAPADYREWVFLSAGLDMNYTASAPVPDGHVLSHVFGNVFVPRTAYRAFMKTGVWPDKTVLILENRVGSSKGSINKSGQFQTGVLGLEAHVKDTGRFKGGWGFFAFDGGKPAKRIDYAASCYSCHVAHAAADTTFVQFYPTLLPVATARGTLSASFLSEERRNAK